jgi:hypothetical protein
VEAVRSRVSVLRILYSTLAKHWRRRSTLVITSIVHASVQSLLCSPNIRLDQKPRLLSRAGHRRGTCIGGWGGGIPVPLTGGGCLISGSLSPAAASSSWSPSSSRRQHAQHLQLHGLSVNAWPARSDTYISYKCFYFTLNPRGRGRETHGGRGNRGRRWRDIGVRRAHLEPGIDRYHLRTKEGCVRFRADIAKCCSHIE